jgi:hypothetical protein
MLARLFSGFNSNLTVGTGGNPSVVNAGDERHTIAEYSALPNYTVDSEVIEAEREAGRAESQAELIKQLADHRTRIITAALKSAETKAGYSKTAMQITNRYSQLQAEHTKNSLLYQTAQASTQANISGYCESFVTAKKFLEF